MASPSPHGSSWLQQGGGHFATRTLHLSGKAKGGIGGDGDDIEVDEEEGDKRRRENLFEEGELGEEEDIAADHEPGAEPGAAKTSVIRPRRRTNPVDRAPDRGGRSKPSLPQCMNENT